MYSRNYGASYPKNDAGGLRRGVSALATSDGRSRTGLWFAFTALLLVCTLMAGAVSAAAEFNQSNFTRVPMF